MRERKRWYRDEIAPRISLARIRNLFTPAKWRRMTSVQVEAGGHAATIRFADTACATTHGQRRRWLVCPACENRCVVVGVRPDIGWSCPRRECGGWVGRSLPTKNRTPRTVAEGGGSSGRYDLTRAILPRPGTRTFILPEAGAMAT